MPHRPAAFPAHLPLGAGFPLRGTLELIIDFPSAPDLPNATTDIYGCTPVTPILQSASSRNETRIALVVRGHCSFSHKVRAAQARGANAVLVADDTASEEETEEQGRTRFGLLTMYSPGMSPLLDRDITTDKLWKMTQTIFTSLRRSSLEHRSSSSGT